MDINFQMLIPPVDDCQELFISRKILEEVRQPLETTGMVVLSRCVWKPQHLYAIMQACKDRGYKVEDDITVVISLPEFDITSKQVGFIPDSMEDCND